VPFEPIAIIGAAARLPGADDLDSYWRLLLEGRDVVSEIPDGRWTKSHFFHPKPGQAGKAYTWAAGVLSDIEGFDAAYFGISPREAAQIDPAQRLLLELTAETLEDAGMPAAKLAGSRTGVFMGASGTEYGNQRLGDPAGANAYFMLGTTTGIVANRISYVFDLKGPSFIVDTACSSSLVALDLACSAIVSGEAEMALAGGVNMLLNPFPFIGFCSASMLSPLRL
jgi:phthiocerol/phenolphthiocerol synthesis type-I polyketide synthase C